MMRPRSRPRASPSVRADHRPASPQCAGWQESNCGRGAGPAQRRLPLAEEVRYNERSAAERVKGGLKDDFGGRYVRVRGHAKVFCHLMFGVLALAIDHLMRLIT